MNALTRRREVDGRFARRTRLARGIRFGLRAIVGGARLTLSLVAAAIRTLIAVARWSPEISATIEIEGVTPQRAWMELIDLERRAVWSRLHREIATNGDGSLAAEGASFSGSLRIGPFTLRDQLRVTTRIPPRLLIASHRGALGGTMLHAVEPLRGRSGCRVRWTERPSIAPVLSPLIGLLVALPLSVGIGADLRRLRRELMAERARRS
jgi:hypothetical protein